MTCRNCEESLYDKMILLPYLNSEVSVDNVLGHIDNLTCQFEMWLGNRVGKCNGAMCL